MQTSSHLIGHKRSIWRAIGASIAGVVFGALAVTLLLASRVVPFLALQQEDKALESKVSATQPCC